MRLPAEPRRGRHRIFGLLIASASLAGCGGASSVADLPGASTALAEVEGPSADYPVVVGDPYRVGETVYTPADTLNYDEVGYAVAEENASSGVSGAHHTLPLPSYVEVTSLDSGRTILVRIERRGPMNSNLLVALSSAALDQLQARDGVAVRVRRVNPPEEQRALLRSGQAAPLRMDTPASLVSALRRKLEHGSASATLVRTQGPAEISEVDPGASHVAPEAPEAHRAASEAMPEVAGSLPVSGASEAFVVQAAAFSTRDRAEKVAGELGGEVSESGKYFRVRTGPFATRGQAEASLAKVRDAGYTDARIFTKG